MQPSVHAQLTRSGHNQDLVKRFKNQAFGGMAKALSGGAFADDLAVGILGNKDQDGMLAATVSNKIVDQLTRLWRENVGRDQWSVISA
jgi:hypothetical protein